MNNKYTKLIIFTVNLILFGIFFVLHYSELFSIKILGASPILPLSLLVAVSMFSSEITASLTGLILGFFMDSSSSASSFFYTITFLMVGFAVSFIVHFFFNKNIRSALALALMACVFIFICRWAFLYIPTEGLVSSIEYLLRNAMPSAVYTTVCIVPFYFIERKLNDTLNNIRT